VVTGPVHTVRRVSSRPTVHRMDFALTWRVLDEVLFNSFVNDRRNSVVSWFDDIA